MSSEGIGPIKSVTISTPNIELATRAYCELLGFSVVDSGTIEASDSLALVAPKTVGNQWTRVQAGNPQLGSILFVSGNYQPPETFRTLGWAAIEILVSDVDALVAQCTESPFEVLVPPISVGSGSVLRAAQLRGPSGEGVYLTQVDSNPAGFSLPQGEHAVAGIFIVVLAASHLENSRNLLENRFALRRVTDHHLPIRILNRAFDLPAQTLHRISSLHLAGNCVIETDQYPVNAEIRQRSDGDLPSGISVVTVYAPEIRESEFLLLPDGAILELTPK
ncbi:MAG: hypothetical protein WC800_06730 [Candidatus Nanopelagicaceae bacterium]|jgi:catechol 2,3-dioxygenase-like lactoylglutathione lyase family enzyme